MRSNIQRKYDLCHVKFVKVCTVPIFEWNLERSSCQPGEHEKIGNMFEELAGNFTQLGVDGNGNASNDFENRKK